MFLLFFIVYQSVRTRPLPITGPFGVRTEIAEGERFELSVSCPTYAFQAYALDHYANPPPSFALYCSIIDLFSR